MINNLTTILESEQYSTKSFDDNTVKINTFAPDSYRKLIRHLEDEKIIYHTYQIKDQRAYRVVIRNIHPSIGVHFIKEALKEKGHSVRNIINVRHRVEKTPLPLFFVDLEPAANNKQIYSLRSLGNMQIAVEPPRRKNFIIQCTRCQSYGHSKTYCRKPFQCVKCGGEHNSATCSKSKDTPATCALCDGPHTANYKGCEVYLNLQARKSPIPNTTPRRTPSMFRTMNTEQNMNTRNVSSPTYAQIAGLQRHSESSPL